jgi:hypothetical protein
LSDATVIKTVKQRGLLELMSSIVDVQSKKARLMQELLDFHSKASSLIYIYNIIGVLVLSSDIFKIDFFAS